MAALSDAEYQELRKFAVFHFDHFMGYSVVPNVEVLDKMGYRKAVNGVRQAVGDIVDSSSTVGFSK